MHDLKSPRSESVSEQNRRQPYNGSLEPEIAADVQPDPLVEDAAEPDELLSKNELDDEQASQRYQPSYSGSIPSPQDSTVYEPKIRPQSLRMQWRFWRTLGFAAWLFVRVLFWQVLASRYFSDYVKRTEVRRWRKYARQFRNFAVKLGGVYIKLGQFISTRVDIFPEEIIQELASLQDEVPTIDFDPIRTVLEAELGTLTDHFASFSEKPIAAASLGQVHRAQLLNGERVVVKVQRPGIRRICFTDLAAMRVVARVAGRFRFISNRADAPALVEEFGKVLLEELSYKHEAYNAYRFTQMFKDDLGVYIPVVYNDHSTDKVLTLEDVTSIKINDYAAMEKAGISRKVVASRLMDTYLPQVFIHFFFHADPHPGNLFVYPLPVEDETADFGPDGRPFYLIFVDFGMTGSLTHEIADGIVSTMSAVLSRDARRLVESYVKLGFVLPDADLERIVEATEATFDQVWGLTMDQMRNIDYARVTQLAKEFNDLIFSMPFYIPQDFIYLIRTISILSGICTSLDPTYNPWDELQPYTETLIARGFGINVPHGQLLEKSLSTTLIQNLLTGNGTDALLQIGREAGRFLLGDANNPQTAWRKLNQGEIPVTAHMDASYRQQMKRLERASRRTSRAVFFGSVLITSTLFYVSGEMAPAVVGYVLCALTLILGPLRD